MREVPSTMDELTRLQKDKILQDAEAQEMRQLGVQLAKTVQNLRDERDTLERELQTVRTVAAERDGQLLGSVTELNKSCEVMRCVNDWLRQLMRGSDVAVPQVKPPSYTPCSSSPNAAHVLATQSVASIVAEVTVAADLSDKFFTSPAAVKFSRTLPPNLATKTLETKVAYLRSRLEQLPKYELENDRLRRALKAQQKRSLTDSLTDSPIQEHHHPPSPEVEEGITCLQPFPPKRRDHSSPAPATVVRMPGSTEEGENATQMPVRSCGTQCALLGDVGGFRHKAVATARLTREPSIDGRALRSASPEYFRMGGFEGVRSAVSPSAINQVRRSYSPTVSRGRTPTSSPVAPRRGAPSPVSVSRTASLGRIRGDPTPFSPGGAGMRRSTTPNRGVRRSNTPTSVVRGAPGGARSVTPTGSRPTTPRSLRSGSLTRRTASPKREAHAPPHAKSAYSYA